MPPDPAPAAPVGDRQGLAIVVLLGLIWGSAYPVIRYGILAGATPIAFAAARYAISALAIAALAAATRLPRPTGPSLLLSGLLGIPIVGVYGLLLYWGEQTTSGGLSSILIGTTPLLTVLVALPILSAEPLHRAGYLGLGVGFAGVVVLVAPPPGVTLASSLWGPLAVLGAAVSFAMGSVLLRARRPEGETLWGLAAQFTVATVFLAGVIPILEPNRALPASGGVLAALLYLVVLPSVAGYALYAFLHHQVGPSRANVVAYVNPVAALTIGVFLFGETFQWWELVGFGLIVVGLTLLSGFGRAPQRPEAANGNPSVQEPRNTPEERTGNV
ncbi:MAG TPA: DMT family transporter [Thermoplasmata archaeon]|nr:DMT family transporter [Thermoplasmata archaeon]